MEAARHAHEGACGTIKIGIPSRLGGVLSAATAEHSKRFPALDVQRKDICSSLQNEALRNGEIDIGFFRPPSTMLTWIVNCCSKKSLSSFFRRRTAWRNADF
jgi:DNA-binding transcriptional LysR family regulator